MLVVRPQGRLPGVEAGVKGEWELHGMSGRFPHDMLAAPIMRHGGLRLMALLCGRKRNGMNEVSAIMLRTP